MPKLWTDTIDAHRRAVRDAALDAAAALVTRHGVTSVTMSRIAEETGVGRATLYKYFRDVEAVLLAWHERQVGRHLQQLVEARDRAGTPAERLEAVLLLYADTAHHHRHEGELVGLLHRGAHVVQAEQDLRVLVGALVAEGAAAGDLREDVAPGELAAYCLHALTAAGELGSPAAVRRLVDVTLAGLRPSP